MPIILHSLELDADREHCTFRLQLDETETITCRVRVERKDNGAMSFNSSDGSFEELTSHLIAMAKKETLPGSIYLADLLAIIVDQMRDENRYDRPLYFPILINGHRLKPRQPSLWKRLRARFAPNIRPVVAV